MEFTIKEITKDSLDINAVKDFLYEQIKNEYNIGPNMEFHYDIEGIKKYYLLPEGNAFFVALDGDKIIATAAVRAYDKDYEFFRGIYSKEYTASIWRLMVDKEYRRLGLARKLVNTIENFARNKGYTQIYLHTHRYLEAAVPFWKSVGYNVTVEEDFDETTHMEKNLN